MLWINVEKGCGVSGPSLVDIFTSRLFEIDKIYRNIYIIYRTGYRTVNDPCIFLYI